MDENKIFDMLEKIYIEVQSHGKRLDSVDKRLDGVDKRLDSVDSRLDNVDKRLDGVENRIKKLGVTIDGDIRPKIEALFDGYKVNTEKLEIMDEKLDKLQMDVNTLTMKTASNDNRIIELSRNMKRAK